MVRWASVDSGSQLHDKRGEITDMFEGQLKADEEVAEKGSAKR